MPTKKSKSSKEILSTSAQLSNIVDKTFYLGKLEQSLFELLPPLIKAHCSVANIREGKLILHVDTASCGMQLRHLTKQLLNELQQEKGFTQINSINYKVRPQEKPLPPIIRSQSSLSAENKTLLAELKRLLAEII